MSDLGTVFPPRDEWDIAAYPEDDVMSGYLNHSIHDPIPGGNHAPGYRWGWLNARKDVTHQNDGYEHIRYQYIRMMRH